MIRMLFAVVTALFFAITPSTAQTKAYDSARPFGTLRQQAAVQQAWLQERLETVLPRLMRQHGVDMWVVTMREYNEDPVFTALVSPTTFAARRRTIYIFFDRGEARGGIERLALGGTSQGNLYEAVRETQMTSVGQPAELWGASQWDLFARVVRERNPRRIAVNIAAEHNFADGLTAGEWEQMERALGRELASRVVREPRLAIDYLATRVPSMTQIYRRMQLVVHDIISAAFSNYVITPGVTTTEDVVWWMRQRVNDLGLTTWFQPSVSIQRRGTQVTDADPVIMRGDVLHTDFGITALRLNTDTQHMAYVLRDGETDAPSGLQTALSNANRLQDILFEETRPGRTGNEILVSVLEKMRAEGLDGTMYTHPIGDHGHGAGPLIGLWDRQGGVPGRGDVPVLPSMWFSTELQVTTRVPEWDNQPVRMMLEEEAEITADGEMRWMLRRQTELHLIR